MDMEKTLLFTHTGVSTDPATLMDENGERVGEFNYVVLDNANVMLCRELKELAVASGRKTAHVRVYGTFRYAGKVPPRVELKNLVEIDYEPFKATSVPRIDGVTVGICPTVFFVDGKLWTTNTNQT